ncbi:MAG: MogA/MoaB family molybdenum cofactor biosynthesis protein [Solirubrobacterales bacterium]
MIKAVLITVSTSRAAGGSGADTPEDVSGERLVALANSIDAEVVGREIIADDHGLIAERLKYWSDEAGADLVLTSGGTGLAPSDQTPEATSSVIDRPAPGIAEAIRQAAAEHTKHWPLGRGVAGIRGSTLMINLPGSPRSIDQSAPVLTPIIGHAVALLQGVDARH